MDREETYIRGTMMREIYYNEANSYGVYLFQIESSSRETKNYTTIVGQFLRLHEEESYLCYGEWTEHPKFGRQFQVTQLQKEIPYRREAVIKYLSSDLFPGIGKKTAQKVVDQFGEQALEQLASQPELLQKVEGLSSEQLKTLQSGLREHIALEQMMVFLYELGFGPVMALKIVQLYKEETMERIKEDPYRLIRDVEGIGFQRADELAQKLGMTPDAPERYQAAVLYLLQEASFQQGHVYLTRQEIDEGIRHLLGTEVVSLFSEEVQTACIEELIVEQEIKIDEDRLYLPSLYYAEWGVAKRIKECLEVQEEPAFTITELYREIGALEEEGQINYAEEQREALVTAMSEPLMILTGGPGTGKTTVIRGICQLYARLHQLSYDPQESTVCPIRLAAPTGRAAKRMEETTGLPAMTIHRLLGFNGSSFEHHSQAPIGGELLIVDEVSMLDIRLANQLFRAVPPEMKIVLVGDQNQLPSVGPGQVLKHLLDVPEIPRIMLQEIFRQAEGSSIIELAHHVKEGQVPADLLAPLADRRFFRCSLEQTVEVVVQTYLNAIERGYTLHHVQILSPIYNGPAGVHRLNAEIQRRLNPRSEGKKEVQLGEQFFRQGDKVLQLINHPDHPVYNGDMGTIIAIDEEAQPDEPVCWVRFDRQEVPYQRSQLSQLQLAYACSIHKAQGSEFAIVIMPVLKNYRRMLRRNLLYTGITRSQSYLILCGEESAFIYGVKNGEAEQRNSCLQELIQAEW